MTTKRREPEIVKTGVTWGQLFGVAVTLLIIMGTSYVNLLIQVNAQAVRITNTEQNQTEIKMGMRDIQSTQNIILQKLGAMEARIDDVKSK